MSHHMRSKTSSVPFKLLHHTSSACCNRQHSRYYTAFIPTRTQRPQLRSSSFVCRGVVHRDLKLENLLLATPNDIHKVKIADFGLAKKAAESAMATICGTPQYVAPEVIQVQPMSFFTASVSVYWWADSLSVCLSALPCLPLCCLFACLSAVCLFVHPSVCAYVCLCVCFFVFLSVCLFSVYKLTGGQKFGGGPREGQRRRSAAAALPVCTGSFSVYAMM